PRPLVYLALGSSGNRRLALDAAHSLGAVDANVVAPIRHFLEPGDEATLPSNVHLVGLVPAHRLGGLVDAAVLHGGQGTVQTACATGIPFVGMGLQPEQGWNIEVCVRAGLAISLRPSDARTPRLAEAVRQALIDQGMRQAAERMREVASREDGAAVSARFVEDLVSGRTPTGA
ncbi:MAG: glycosyltransferase, partial [Pseudoclavibacter sp.]